MARLLGVDLPRNKAIKIALRAIYGVGPAVAAKVLVTTSINPSLNTNDLSDDHVKSLRSALDDFSLEGDLRREIALNIKRLKDLACYRGIRHKKGLPVRGQRTHTNARTRKGPAVAIAGKKSIKQMK
jgi:small subunit ribosomal protein S13